MPEVKGWLTELIADVLRPHLKPKDQRLAKPYPHAFISPLMGKGRMTRLASGLARGEKRARKEKVDPTLWRGMQGVMSIHTKKGPHKLGEDMAFREMLDDMARLSEGSGKITLEEAVKAWKR